MAISQRRRRWGNTKPTLGVGISTSHPRFAGMVGCWVLNEGGGPPSNHAFRSSATVAGGVSWTNGSAGPALSFNGSNGALSVPDVGGLSFNGPVTILASISTTSSSPQVIYGGYLGSGGFTGIGLGTSIITGGKLSYWSSAQGAWAETSAVATGVAWHQVGVTASGTNVQAYIGGQPAGALTSHDSVAWSGAKAIGAAAGGATSFFNGFLEYLYLWNRALSAAEVADVAADPYAHFLGPSRRRLFGPPAGGATSSTGTASGSATAAGVGSALDAAIGTASGSGSAAGVGGSAAAAVGTASGSGSASAVGAALDAATGTASGSGSASAVGSSAATSAGTASGSATAAGVGAATAASAGTAAGSGSASGVGASAAAAVGTAAGSATVAGVGSSLTSGSGVGSATGSGSASGVGASTAATAGTASGTSTAPGVGASAARAAGSASGSSTASGVGSGSGAGPTVVFRTAFPVPPNTAAASIAGYVPEVTTLGGTAFTDFTPSFGTSVFVSGGGAKASSFGTGGASSFNSIDLGATSQDTTILWSFTAAVGTAPDVLVQWHRDSGGANYLDATVSFSGNVLILNKTVAGSSTELGRPAVTLTAGHNYTLSAANAGGLVSIDLVDNTSPATQHAFAGQAVPTGTGNRVLFGQSSATAGDLLWTGLEADVAGGASSAAGTAAGTSTVSGVGASAAGAAGSSAGTSSASGLGAATARAAGTASGTSTASGVGSTGPAGSAGTASGTSAASGVGASTAASAGTAAGTSAAHATGSGGAPLPADLDAAIVARFAADATLPGLATAIYYGVAADAARAPYVVFTQTSVKVHGNPVGRYERLHYRVNCFARTAAAAVAIGDAVIAAYHLKPLEFDDGYLMSARWGGGATIPDHHRGVGGDRVWNRSLWFTFTVGRQVP